LCGSEKKQKQRKGGCSEKAEKSSILAKPHQPKGSDAEL